MARGFESKSVAAQQELARELLQSRSDAEDADAAVALKRRRLELGRAEVLHQLGLAQAEAHKEMLRRALAAVEKELSAIP